MADEETVKMPHRTVADGYNDRPTTAPSPADTTKTTSFKIGESNKQRSNGTQSICAALVAIAAIAAIVVLFIFATTVPGGVILGLVLIGLAAAVSV